MKQAGVLFVVVSLLMACTSTPSNTKTLYFVADVDTTEGQADLYTEQLTDSVVDVKSVTEACNENGMQFYSVTIPDSLTGEDADIELRFYLQYNEKPDEGVTITKLSK